MTTLIKTIKQRRKNLMRNVDRIPEVLNQLEKFWKLFPDWRFMQLINNIQRAYGNDMFYVEDDKFKELIEVLTEMEFIGL